MYNSQFRAFHAVALFGGFSKAAKELNRTQPAISDQVRKLEERFGTILFERRRHKVWPTALGERLFEVTRRMFQMEEEAIELLTESQALKVGHLNIAADGPHHGVRLVSEFWREYPDISVALKIGNSGEVLNQLINFGADIAVLAHVPEDRRLTSMVLRRDPLVVFIAHDHPWSKRRSISLKQLSGVRLIMRERGSVTRAIIEAEFKRIGANINIAMEADGRETAREAVAAGIGVGIVSEPEFGFDKRLRAIKLTGCKSRVTEKLVCLTERAHLKTVRAFFASASKSGSMSDNTSVVGLKKPGSASAKSAKLNR